MRRLLLTGLILMLAISTATAITGCAKKVKPGDPTMPAPPPDPDGKEQ